MKRFIFMAVAGLLVLAGCNGDKPSKEAQQAGQAFQTDLRQMPDSAFAHYEAMLGAATDKEAFKRQFIAQMKATGNDSLYMAALITALDSAQLGDTVAQPIIDGLKDGSMTVEQARQRRQLLMGISYKLNKPQTVPAFNHGLDQRVTELGIDDQMKVYAASATPDELGRQMRTDATKPGANAKEQQQRVDALKKIYSEADFNTFLRAYRP